MSNTKRYWQDLSELDPAGLPANAGTEEFNEPMPLDQVLADGSITGSTTSRRDFLKFLGFSVGAATLALRVGWKLLNSRLNAVEPQRMQPPAPAPRQEIAPRSGGRRIRIRSSWAVGDANGVWRQGTSEHIIEFDD